MDAYTTVYISSVVLITVGLIVVSTILLDWWEGI